MQTKERGEGGRKERERERDKEVITYKKKIQAAKNAKKKKTKKIQAIVYIRPIWITFPPRVKIQISVPGLFFFAPRTYEKKNLIVKKKKKKQPLIFFISPLTMSYRTAIGRVPVIDLLFFFFFFLFFSILPFPSRLHFELWQFYN